ncbi:hypothetical protein FBQ90_01630 [Betaproteobacteria bacterium PRO5]|nr:hypothetical protein [Betaproteobacteria bacterium PRO5]
MNIGITARPWLYTGIEIEYFPFMAVFDQRKSGQTLKEICSFSACALPVSSPVMIRMRSRGRSKCLSNNGRKPYPTLPEPIKMNLPAGAANFSYLSIDQILSSLVILLLILIYNGQEAQNRRAWR